MDYIDQALERIRTECEKLGFQPSYVCSTDPMWEPDYLVLEPGFSICIDPVNEVGWVSYWSRDDSRYYVGVSSPLEQTDWIMKGVGSALTLVKEAEARSAA